MREIKFRAWDTEENKYYEPVYAAYKGDLHELMVSFNGRLSAHTLNAEKGSCMVDESLFPDRYILEQYTGLKDKNGKEIYEGDIYKYTDAIRTVFFVNGAFCGGWSKDDCMPFGWEGDEEEPNIEIYKTSFPELCEIIGNIHERES